MKHWIVNGVSILLLSLGSAPLALAQATPTAQSGSYLLSPDNLAEAAYRGALEDEGIPGYGDLQAEYNEGITNARDIIRAAVRSGLLPASALKDQRYLNDVDVQLQGLLGPI